MGDNLLNADLGPIAWSNAVHSQEAGRDAKAGSGKPRKERNRTARSAGDRDSEAVEGVDIPVHELDSFA